MGGLQDGDKKEKETKGQTDTTGIKQGETHGKNEVKGEQEARKCEVGQRGKTIREGNKFKKKRTAKYSLVTERTLFK